MNKAVSEIRIARVTQHKYQKLVGFTLQKEKRLGWEQKLITREWVLGSML